MKPSEVLNTHREEIRQLILNNKGAYPRIFGSVARGEDTEDSDLDILIEPTPNLTYMDIGTMLDQIKTKFNIRVDIATPRALPEKFRQKVLDMAVPL